MASAGIIFIEHARRARERAEHVRTLTRCINDNETVERLEMLAREIEDAAAQLERSACDLEHIASHTVDITGEVNTTHELVRRLKKLAGDGV